MKIHVTHQVKFKKLPQFRVLFNLEMSCKSFTLILFLCVTVREIADRNKEKNERKKQKAYDKQVWS